VTELLAPAKINLALVVGPERADGRHEVATVLQRISLADRIALERSDALEVTGFEGDTIVRAALTALAEVAEREPSWRVRIEKQIPVAAGLGGGSSDAAAALRLANDSLARPLTEAELRTIASSIGADVPFFLTAGPQLGDGDGTTLEPLRLPQDYWVLLLLPRGEQKSSSGDVYDRFSNEDGFPERRAAVRKALALGSLTGLPPNDLVSSPLSDELLAHGAFRADVSGAGPTVYGLFEEQPEAVAALAALSDRGRAWIATPAW
jgi:4-diphosphocytidyl-2-C-methyl-D-erythritol kinase